MDSYKNVGMKYRERKGNFNAQKGFVHFAQITGCHVCKTQTWIVAAKQKKIEIACWTNSILPSPLMMRFNTP